MRGPNKCLQPWQIAREKIRRRIREANGKEFYLAPEMRIEIDCKAHLVETGPIARRLGAKMDSLNYMNAAKREVKKEDPQEIARKVGEKEVGAALDKAIMSLVIALENMTPEAWLAVWRRFTYGEEERKLKPDAPIEKILRAFAMSTLENKGYPE